MDQEIPDGYVEGTMLTVGVTHDHDPRYTVSVWISPLDRGDVS
jgi:hypothetical protein